MTISPQLLWVLAFPLEAGAAWLLLSSAGTDRMLAVPLHVVAAGVFGVSLLIENEGRRIWAWSLLGATLALVIAPVMGMLAMALAFMLAQRVYTADPGPAMSAVEAVEAEPVDAVARAQEMEVALLDELEIEPVVDVLRENDPELKRAAIEVITKQGGLGSVRILIGLLHDPSPEARFFSSIGLSRLEDEISRSILAGQRAVAENPSSVVEKERLAQLYVDYAVSGFMEGVSREYYLELARETFEEALPSSADADGVMYRLARVHLLLGSIGEAAYLLDALARRRPDDLEIHLLRMEVIYQFGDFRELVTYAQRWHPVLAGKVEQAEVVAWWANQDQEDEAVAV